MATDGNAIDRLTQQWVRRTGQPITFERYPWLRGPFGYPGEVSGEWLAREAVQVNGRLGDGGGLLEQFDALGGDGFAPGRIAKPIVDFYEQTAEWRMEAKRRWSPGLWPLAWLLSTCFARRLEQFNLPIGFHNDHQKVGSRIVTVRDADGIQTGSGWLRALQSTGQTI